VTEVECKKCGKRMKTSCYSWTIERITDESQLKVGDHICWNRPIAFWHHAIVSETNPLTVIHYNAKLIVVEQDYYKANRRWNIKICGWCNTLYRINYKECYNADYTVLRARELKGETRYNLVERNCEHVSNWCKTGSNKSTQVSIVRTSAVNVGLRIVALVILFLIQFSYEKFETKVENPQVYEFVEKQLTCAYVAVVTLIFAIHLVVTAVRRLPAVPHDIENPCSCCLRAADEYCCWRLCKCSLRTCYSVFCKPVLGLFVHCSCNRWGSDGNNQRCSHRSPTCCGGPGNLVCGIFWRTFVRELPGLVGTVCLVEYEDAIFYDLADLKPVVRTLVVISCIIAVQLVGYVAGALLGRWIQSIGECSSWWKKERDKESPSTPSSPQGNSNQPKQESSTSHTDTKTGSQVTGLVPSGPEVVAPMKTYASAHRKSV